MADVRRGDGVHVEAEEQSSCMGKQKRKRVSDSDSTPSSRAKYKARLRKTTTPSCIFRRSSVFASTSSSGESTTSSLRNRGPSTSKWTSEHVDRLNFHIFNVPLKPDYFSDSVGLLSACVKQPLNELLFRPLTTGGAILYPPDIADGRVVEKIATEITENEPILKYMGKLVGKLREAHAVTVKDKEGLDKFDQCFPTIAATVDKESLSTNIVSDIHDLVGDLQAAYAVPLPETKLDTIVENLIKLILEKEGLSRNFATRVRCATRVSFLVQGAKMSSQTNILLEYIDRSKSYCKRVTVPIVLSENKTLQQTTKIAQEAYSISPSGIFCCVPLTAHTTTTTVTYGSEMSALVHSPAASVTCTSEKEATGQTTAVNIPAALEPTGTASTLHESTASSGRPAVPRGSKRSVPISQIIGQCVSMSEQSPFETDQFKIVYHICLIGSSRVVITRTHVAKSTLHDMKGDCKMTSKENLSKSYMFTKSFDVTDSAFKCFQVLYMAYIHLIKLIQHQILGSGTIINPDISESEFQG
ncbi:uncharacterized protein [Ptychodera flava]|uniref:uncharacterized protein n=1 Tax=Ptychodera flava TaxID=63121 RepID=UPI00396A59F5